MDCVIVLSDGAKVCFTATLRGAETDIVPGDTVKRRIVGYLGHDGKTGCGAKFTNIRVVCQNTLTAALSESGAHSSITHKNGANNNFDALISSIDVARQDFVTECELMREFSRASMGHSQFNDFVDEVYNIDEGQVFRKRDKLERQAFRMGYGSEFAPMSIWNGINAITQVETSTRGTTAAKGRAQFARGTFGAGAQISKKAFAIARRNAVVIVKLVFVMYKYLCARLLLPLSLASVLLPSPVRAEAQCWLPGTVQVSMAERQLTVKGTICTDLPPHIKPYLSAHNYAFATQGCVDVRINDRGPYIGARELDLVLFAKAILWRPGCS